MLLAKDLASVELGTLSWDEGSRAESLTAVYGKVVESAKAAVGWYAKSRLPKKWAAMSLRWLSVLLVSASGLVPLLAALQWLPAPDQGGLDPLVTSFMVALAAALFGLDKFFSYSSTWMRYVRTGLAVRTALGEFEFEWQLSRAAWQSPEPTAEQAADMLARCSAFASRVNAIVAEETNAWITDFQASLSHLGESVRTAEARVEAAEAKRVEAAQTGALNVTVRHDGKVWSGPMKLQVGRNKLESYSGPTVALTDLPAGPRRIAAEGIVAGKLYRAELAVDVVPGRTSPATLELAAVEAPAD